MTTEDSIRQQVLEFRQARNWPQQETAEQLAQALVAEAAGIQARIEESVYLSPYKPRHIEEKDIHERESKIRRTIEERRRVSSNLADIGIYALALCDHLDIDLERAMAAKLKILEDKYPSESTLALIALVENPQSVVDIPIDYLMLLWRENDGVFNWDEVARNLTSVQRRWISQEIAAWDWGIIYDISRNLEKTDREGIAAVIATGVPVALEELLTYNLDLSDEEFEKIRQSLKRSGWRDLSEKRYQRNPNKPANF